MYFHSIIVHSRSETLETSRSFQTIYIYIQHEVQREVMHVK